MKTIKNFFEKTINFIFPKGSKLKFENISIEKLEDKISISEKQNEIKCLSFFKYKDEDIKNIIWNIKYKNDKKAIKKIAAILHPYLVEIIADKNMFYNDKNFILIPMPISRRRFIERGFNQTEKICEAIRKIDKNNSFFIQNNILKKKFHTKSQTKTKNKKEREENLKGSFKIANKNYIKGRNIILLDDVTTTGTTIKEASKTLKNSGAKNVFPIAIARS